MNNPNMLFLCGLVSGIVVKCLYDSMAVHPGDRRKSDHDQNYIRPADRRHMKNPPQQWDDIDEQSDESFPASDPPGNY